MNERFFNVIISYVFRLVVIVKSLNKSNMILVVSMELVNWNVFHQNFSLHMF